MTSRENTPLGELKWTWGLLTAVKLQRGVRQMLFSQQLTTSKRANEQTNKQTNVLLISIRILQIKNLKWSSRHKYPRSGVLHSTTFLGRWDLLTEALSTRIRFHLKTQTFCCVFMSRLHENDESDVSFSIKTQTFENALQSGKIWKRNAIIFVCTCRIHWKHTLLKTIGRHVITVVPSHLKIREGG